MSDSGRIRLDWAAIGAQIGKRAGEEIERRGLLERGAKLLEAARPYLPPDVSRQVARVEALIALGFLPTDEPTDEEIAAAYKEIARTCHPDRNPDPAAHAKFKAASSARAVLTKAEPG